MSSIADNDDVISYLSDTVLCHILGFLPTKHAVATSVLSKRWTHLWRSVLVICFGGHFYEEEKLIRFNDIVNSVLLSRDSSSIKSFSLNVSYNNNGDNNNLDIIGFPSLVKWIDHVVQHSVETLHLSVYSNNDGIIPKLSNTILTCRTLVVLELNTFAVNGFSSIRLPLLKTLSIHFCTFSNGQDFLLLLSGCPILEDLLVYALKFDFLDDYQECENLDLRKLTKAHMPYTYCYFPLKALHNVREMYIELNKVYRSFDEIPIFHNLIKLKLGSINSNWYLLVQVLNHCPNVENLQLFEGTKKIEIEEYVQKKWVDPKLVPHCVSLQFKTCSLWNDAKSQLMLAKYILKNARFLQTMQIFCTKNKQLIESKFECTLY